MEIKKHIPVNPLVSKMSLEFSSDRSINEFFSCLKLYFSNH